MTRSREESFQLVDTFFTQRALKALKTTRVRNAEGRDNPGGEVPNPFNERAIQALALDLKNRLTIYLGTKDIPTNDDHTLPKHIETPHPIGLTTTMQSIIIDMLFRMQTAIIRKRHADLHPDPAKAKKYSPSQEVGDSYLDLYAFKLMKELRDLKIITSHAGKDRLAALLGQVAENKMAKTKGSEEIFYQLADLLTEELLYCGHATRIIDKETQEKRAGLKQRYLDSDYSLRVTDTTVAITKTTSEDRRKTWEGTDKDGDAEASFHHTLYAQFGEDLPYQPFTDVARFLAGHYKDKTAHEGRRSNEKKNGVEALGDIAEGIDGLKHVTELRDLTDIHKLKHLATHIRALKYSGEGTTQVPGNIPLDLLFDVSSLVNEGLVISDFPGNVPDAKKLVYQLLFITRTMDTLLHEGGIQPATTHGQVLLPLCEEQRSIENFHQVILEIYRDIQTGITAINTNKSLSTQEKNKAIFDLLYPFIVDFGDGSKKFALGAFPGPSDLTKRMGTAALLRIAETIANSYTSFHGFKEWLIKNVPEEVRGQLELDRLEILVEYGKGTALRRGANSVLPVGATNQGTSTSADKLGAKVYNKLLDRRDLNLANLQELQAYIRECETFIQGASAAHGYFFQSVVRDDPSVTPGPGKTFDFNESEQTWQWTRLGAIVEWYDNHFIRHPLSLVVAKDASDNQGVRGVKAKGEYRLSTTEASRAIGDAAAKTLSGLLSEAPFPQGDIDASMPKSGFPGFISKPLGLMMAMQALNQMVSTDTHRARIFNCPEELIKEQGQYLYNIATYLGKQTGKAVPSFDDFQESPEVRLQCTLNLVQGLKESRYITSPTLLSRLDLFAAQLPLLAQTSQLLTKEMQDLSGELARNERIANRSNAAYLTNLLTNFRGTPMQLMEGYLPPERHASIPTTETDLPSHPAQGAASAAAQVTPLSHSPKPQAHYWKDRTALTCAIAAPALTPSGIPLTA